MPKTDPLSTISLAFFLFVCFPFLILKRSKSQGLDIRQLVAEMHRPFFVFFSPRGSYFYFLSMTAIPLTAETQGNPERGVLWDSADFDAACPPAKESQGNSNSRLCSPNLFSYLQKRTLPQKIQYCLQNLLVLLNVKPWGGGGFGYKIQNLEVCLVQKSVRKVTVECKKIFFESEKKRESKWGGRGRGREGENLK